MSGDRVFNSGLKPGPPAPPAGLRRRMETAIMLQRNGRLEEALAAYREITALVPKFPDAFHFGGLTAHALGKDELARTWLAAAERLAPERPGFLLNTARFFQEIGALEEAETRAAHAWRIAPKDPRALMQYAICLIELGRGDALIGELEALAKAMPEEPRIQLLLARSLLQGGRRDAARTVFAEICRASEIVSSHLEFAEFLLEEGELEAAREKFASAVRSGDRSERAIAERGLAIVAGQTGDKTAARRHAAEALNCDAGMHIAWLLRIEASEDSELENLQPALEEARKAAQPPGDYALDFALGNLYERHGKYPSAWDAYGRANRSRRATLQYDPGRDARFFSEARRCLGGDFVARHAEAGIPDELPVFIVGMPRSGTTLLERALGAHPAVRAGGEMKVIHDILRRRAGPENRRNLPRWLAQRASGEIREIAEEWLAALRRESQGAERLTDKMPSNFGLLGLIRVCFPDATVIHMRRDPRDVFVSAWANLFEGGIDYCYDPEEFRAYYSGYRAMMRHWERNGLPRKFIEVEYETLVENFDATVTKTLETIGLDWHPDCARFASQSGSVATRSWFQVRRPLYSSSAGRWKHFREQLGPLAKPETWQTPPEMLRSPLAR
ncbi:MAG: sulfotransferase [Gammaproteobacteria bacterium]